MTSGFVHHQMIGLVAVIVCALHSDHVLMAEEDENRHGEDTEGKADDYLLQHRDDAPPPPGWRCHPRPSI